jgi:hypothetical protein
MLRLQCLQFYTECFFLCRATAEGEPIHAIPALPADGAVLCVQDRGRACCIVGEVPGSRRQVHLRGQSPFLTVAQTW